MLISVEQVKAARALLGWSQKELGQAAGLTQDHVANYESQRSRSLEVLEAIHQALAAQGIVFTPYGVERRHEVITFLDGPDCYLELLDDVAKSDAVDVYLIGADDARSSEAVDHKVGSLTADGKMFHYLIGEDVTVIKQKKKQYRKIPGEWLKNRDVTVIYGDTYAFYLPTGAGRIMKIKNQYLADDYRHLFELLWGMGHDV